MLARLCVRLYGAATGEQVTDHLLAAFGAPGSPGTGWLARWQWH
jgi:hypothetical protein